MTESAILDTGPLVSFLDENESTHAWAVDALRRVRGPVVTCEPVLTEAMYLLRTRPAAQDRILEWLGLGTLTVPLDVFAESATIRRLMKKYRDVPMSFADACVVRMAELFDDHRVCTLERDFRVYRKHGRAHIPLISPERR